MKKDYKEEYQKRKMYFAMYYRDSVRTDKVKMQYRRELSYFRKYGKLRPKFPKKTGKMVILPQLEHYRD